jgi:hypothetical protein
MTLDPKQERFWDIFFPGIIADVRKLGTGNFQSQPVELIRYGVGLKGVNLRLEYDLSCKNYVQIRINLRLRKGQPPYRPWEPVNLAMWVWIYYSMHYGVRQGDGFFRFDLDEPSGHHVHILPNMAHHTSCSEIEPDVSNLDPRRFVTMVAAYQQHRQYPVWRKP